jgi:ATP-dependent Zn protease
MSLSDRQGAAYHEAGHAVVASALGLAVGRIEIAIDGDDARGSTDIQDDVEPPLVDQIAVCAAGVEAQKLFDAPTHDGAGWGDYGKMVELLDGFDDEASSTFRNAGHQRAYELLLLHEDKVERVVEALIPNHKIEADKVRELLK